MDVKKDGRVWPVGTGGDIAWIQEATHRGMEITSAIPPVFEAYATIDIPSWEDTRARRLNTRTVIETLAPGSEAQPWWLGYLVTGDAELVFPDTPQVELYASWNYELVLARPEEALTWRLEDSWRPGPDLVFPADRSWLLSWLWDDEWQCLGGPAELVDRLVKDSRLEARRVDLGEDATPPGKVAW